MKRWVIISGGCGVLGQSFARALAEDGYEPLLLDIAGPKSDKPLVGEFLRCDITEPSDVMRLEGYIGAPDAEVHGLINNASCQPPGFAHELEDYSVECYRRVLDVNLAGSFLLTRAVVPYMQRQRFGSIINIGSIQGVVAPTFEIYAGTGITSPLAYAVAKAGMIHFAKWVAARYGNYNVRCNAVSPGGVNDHQKGGGEFLDVYCSRTPLNRMVRSAEVAELVRFLISNRSAYITGQNIVIDGGWTAH